MIRCIYAHPECSTVFLTFRLVLFNIESIKQFLPLIIFTGLLFAKSESKIDYYIDRDLGKTENNPGRFSNSTTESRKENDNGTSVSAGLYLYMIKAGKFRKTKKMVLLK